VTECVASNELGSAGVTVLGIALSAIRSLGNDFIDVNLNGEPISLFNSHKHTVMDVLLQAGINPSLLIGKTGKNVRFTINGKKRLAFGTMGTNASITINDKNADIESEIDAGDDIKVIYAQNGRDAEAKVCEFINNINSLSIYVDDKIVNLEPVCIINGERKAMEEVLQDEDEVKVFLPNKVEDFKKYVIKEEIKLYINNEELNEDFILEEGNKLYTKCEKKDEEVATELEVAIKSKETAEIKEKNPIMVIVNGKEVHLSGKEFYIFVDVFNHIEFDLTTPKGIVDLTLNGKSAAYTDKLAEGDEISISWK
jgi:hypothetical protein